MVRYNLLSLRIFFLFWTWEIYGSRALFVVLLLRKKKKKTWKEIVIPRTHGWSIWYTGSLAFLPRKRATRHRGKVKRWDLNYRNHMNTMLTQGRQTNCIDAAASLKMILKNRYTWPLRWATKPVWPQLSEILTVLVQRCTRRKLLKLLLLLRLLQYVDIYFFY